tara:strand:+ start:204 stop:443 length:240 start_codon:yes stop_codon:yes gene_type:complete
VSKLEFTKLTKSEFNKYWRPYFLEMTDEELYTIIIWVTQMKDADMWRHFVNHAMNQLERSRMKQLEEENINEPEEEVLH